MLDESGETKPKPRLTYKRQRLLAEMASGKHSTVTSAANSAGMSQRNAYRLATNDVFLEQLEHRRQTQADKAKRIASKALDIVGVKLNSPDVTIGEAAGVAKVATEIYEKTDDGEQLQAASHSREWWQAWLRRGLHRAYRAGQASVLLTADESPADPPGLITSEPE